jgi:hypothetical protein
MPLQIPVQAAKTSLNATSCGIIHLKLKGRVITLQDVIYIPKLEFNVISTERIKKITHIKLLQLSQICLQLAA